MKSWVYKLSKEQLAALAKSFQLDDTGSLKDLRKHVHRFAEDYPEEFEGRADEGSALPFLTVTSPGNAGFRTPTAAEPIFYEGKAINQIRKWGCHFDGRDSAAFLERVEELRGVRVYASPGTTGSSGIVKRGPCYGSETIVTRGDAGKISSATFDGNIYRADMRPSCAVRLWVGTRSRRKNLHHTSR